MIDQIGFWGMGLHSGQPCSVTLTREPGPVTLSRGGRRYTRDELWVEFAHYGVRVGGEGGFRLDLVEHLFGACAGLGLQHDLSIVASGEEIPLLDGGAGDFGRALMALSIPPRPPRLTVVRTGELVVEESRYVFAPAAAPSVEVEVAFAPFGVQSAAWDGTAASFLAEIADARTFGYRHQATELRALGRAHSVNPRAVIVLESDGRVMPPGQAPQGPELARHKLLDLLGDLYLYGGPPRGSIRAYCPGHQRNHRALCEGLAAGLLEWRSPAA